MAIAHPPLDDWPLPCAITAKPTAVHIAWAVQAETASFGGSRCIAARVRYADQQDQRIEFDGNAVYRRVADVCLFVQPTTTAVDLYKDPQARHRQARLMESGRRPEQGMRSAMALACQPETLTARFRFHHSNHQQCSKARVWPQGRSTGCHTAERHSPHLQGCGLAPAKAQAAEPDSGPRSVLD